MIHSPGADDPRLTPYRHVGDSRWLLERQLFVAEGRLVVERLLALPTYEIHSVLVTPTAFDSLQPQLTMQSCDVFICDADVVRGVTGFNFHRGCLALAKRPARGRMDVVVAARRLVALEGVGNPDNVGGIFRTAAALGAGGLVLDPASGDPLYRKAIRTSMAASLRLPWVRLDDWNDGLRWFRDAGFTLVAFTPHADAAALQEFASRAENSDRLMLLFGSEATGLTPATLQLAHARVRIRVEPGLDSLNVVVAAGIALERLR